MLRRDAGGIHHVDRGQRRSPDRRGSVNVSANSSALAVPGSRASRSRVAADQSCASVCRVHCGNDRRRSMPMSFSATHRATGCSAIAFESGANRLPQTAAACALPNACARERHAVTFPVAGEELALESRHVDADRTLALAGAALEAEIEHLVHALVRQLRVAELPGHRQPQRVGTAARRMRFFARHHVRRAHRALALLAAQPDAAAHLDGAAESVVLARSRRTSPATACA